MSHFSEQQATIAQMLARTQVELEKMIPNAANPHSPWIGV